MKVWGVDHEEMKRSLMSKRSTLDGKMMKNIEEGEYKYLGILEANGVNNKEMKGQTKKKYIGRVKNILKSKLKGRNITSAINARAVSIWSRIIS